MPSDVACFIGGKETYRRGDVIDASPGSRWNQSADLLLVYRDTTLAYVGDTRTEDLLRVLTQTGEDGARADAIDRDASC